MKQTEELKHVFHSLLFASQEKRLACEQYAEVREELNALKGRSEREIQSLKEHLRLAMAALQEGQKLGNSLDHWEPAAGTNALTDTGADWDNKVSHRLLRGRYLFKMCTCLILNICSVCCYDVVLQVSAPWWLNERGVQKSWGAGCSALWGPWYHDSALVFNHSASEQHRVANIWFHYTGPHVIYKTALFIVFFILAFAFVSASVYECAFGLKTGICVKRRFFFPFFFFFTVIVDKEFVLYQLF